MSLLVKGVTRLSQIEVDADKDWRAKGIVNLEAVAEAMAYGDVIFRGASVLEKLTADAGKGYNFLRSRGPGLSPVWQDIESLVQYMTGAVNRAVSFDLSIPSPSVSQLSQQASNPPGRVATGVLSPPEPAITLDMLTGPGGAVASSPLLDIPSPTVSGNAAIGSPVGGAIADDGGVQTDETVPANNDTASDMTLLPVVPAVDDAYYFGQYRLGVLEWLILESSFRRHRRHDWFQGDRDQAGDFYRAFGLDADDGRRYSRPLLDKSPGIILYLDCYSAQRNQGIYLD